MPETDENGVDREDAAGLGVVDPSPGDRDVCGAADPLGWDSKRSEVRAVPISGACLGAHRCGAVQLYRVLGVAEAGPHVTRVERRAFAAEGAVAVDATEAATRQFARVPV